MHPSFTVALFITAKIQKQPMLTDGRMDKKIEICVCVCVHVYKWNITQPLKTSDIICSIMDGLRDCHIE